MNARLLIAVLLFGLCKSALAADGPLWIWIAAARRANETVCLRTQIPVKKDLRRAQAVVAADYGHARVFLNGQPVARQEAYGPVLKLDLTAALKEGENAFGLSVLGVAGPTAVMARVELEYADGSRQVVNTDGKWQAANVERDALKLWPGEQQKWRKAAALGQVAAYRWDLEPDTLAISPVDDYTQWKRAVAGSGATDPKTFQIVPGFTVELIRSAAKDEDSWVSLTSDARGRWIIGMEKQGLLRLTLPATPGGEVKVERINETLKECRGLVFAHDSLYAMANNDLALFRLRDTNNDDQFDKVEKLAEFAGDVGHGRNQLTLGPDGHVWGIFGDSVFEPQQATKLPPATAKPTKEEKERSGWVARFNEDASQITVVTRGLRNPFGLDFNPAGDLFTYDADAEYDMGSPWYRPTRVDHLVPGGDFGWRRVTQQWPPYLPDRADMPQPTLDIGKGSPTAVVFGTRSRFPPRYREALYILDWAYGRIVAVHLTPRGSSYQASAETFLRGQPLNVTDVEFGADGAMYFVTGGRGTQSGLYRVKYDGPLSEEPAATMQEKASAAFAQEARQTRHALERWLESPEHAELEKLWPQLGSDDPWLRHAARAVFEKLPLEHWKERALAEQDLDSALAARIALARRGEEVHWLPGKFADAAPRQQLELLFLAERGVVETDRTAMLAELRAAYPAETFAVNQRLSLVLAGRPDEHFVETTLKLLDQAAVQPERMHYLFALRNIKNGWKPASRDVYFEYLRRMDDYVGGEGLPAFRKLIREEALAALPENDRPRFQKLLTSATPAWLAELPPARTEVVRKWTVDELSAAWDAGKTKRDPARGKAIFATARCIVCHRAAGPGGLSGPDLSSVARRFSARDILTSIIEPSKAIDEKYAGEVLELTSGRVVTGRIAPGDYRSPDLEVIPNLLEPEKAVKVPKIEIARRTPSPLSPMPTGLIDVLSEEEILDLVAFLLSSGQPDR
jgi:putative heme-binding domain-containing protein